VGQIEAAKAEFSQARDLDRFNSQAEIGLLKVSTFEPILKGNYDPEVIDRRLKFILEQSKNDDIQALDKNKNDDTHALAFLGYIHLNIDVAEAEDYLDRSLTSNAENAWAYFSKGILFDLANRPKGAIAMYDKAVSLSKWNQTFLNNLAYQHFILGNYEEAQNIYNKLLRLHPYYLLSYYILAKTKFRLSEFETAYANLQFLNDLLNDEAAMGRALNRSPWLFHGHSKSMLVLYSETEKREYAHYLTALAAHLVGNATEVQRLLSDAVEDGATARQLITMDITELAQWRPDLEKGLNSFRSAIARN
jgi:tetratricopeptide (TPR) repeat protein